MFGRKAKPPPPPPEATVRGSILYLRFLDPPKHDVGQYILLESPPLTPGSEGVEGRPKRTPCTLLSPSWLESSNSTFASLHVARRPSTEALFQWAEQDAETRGEFPAEIRPAQGGCEILKKHLRVFMYVTDAGHPQHFFTVTPLAPVLRCFARRQFGNLRCRHLEITLVVSSLAMWQWLLEGIGADELSLTLPCDTVDEVNPATSCARVCAVTSRELLEYLRSLPAAPTAPEDLVSAAGRLSQYRWPLTEGFTWAVLPLPEGMESPVGDPLSEDPQGVPVLPSPSCLPIEATNPFPTVLAPGEAIGATVLGGKTSWSVGEAVVRRMAKSGTNFSVFVHQFGFRSSTALAGSPPPPPIPPVKLQRASWWPLDWLWYGTDPFNLALFRLIFGLCLSISCVERFGSGKIEDRYLATDVQFAYDYFEWVPVLPAPWIHIHFAITGIAALFMGLGWFYRPACVILTFSYTWEVLYDASTYNNHYYLIILLCFLFTLCDADAALVPTRQWLGKGPLSPTESSQRPPARLIGYWQLFLFKFTIGLVYFFGGIAKSNYDWIRGYPMKVWMIGLEDYPLMADLVALYFSWGGLFFDYCITGFLLNPTLRPLAFLGCVYFHISNLFMFNIGVFPYMMLGTLALFLETHTLRRWGPWAANAAINNLAPKWPTLAARVIRWRSLIIPVDDDILLSRTVDTTTATDKKTDDVQGSPTSAEGGGGGGSGTGGVQEKTGLVRRVGKGGVDEGQDGDKGTDEGKSKPTEGNKRFQPARQYPGSDLNRARVGVFLVVWILYHCLMPLRHWVFHYGTDHQVAWTESGHRFSWRMMLRHKDCTGEFKIQTLDERRTVTVPKEDEMYPIHLTSKQHRKQFAHPSYIRMQGQRLAEYYKKLWKVKKVRVFANVWCGLNGSPSQPYSDFFIDLTKLRRPGLFQFEAFQLRQTKFV